MRERKSLAAMLAEQAAHLVGRAAKAILDDPRSRDILAAAVGVAQRGQKRLGAVQERVLRAAGLPAKADYEDVSRQVARLKRKIRELSRQVDAGSGARANGEGPAGGDEDKPTEGER